MTPRYGWAPRGSRAAGVAPRNTGKNTSLLAAMTPGGVQAANRVEGATDTALMTAFIERVLVPLTCPRLLVQSF